MKLAALFVIASAISLPAQEILHSYRTETLPGPLTTPQPAYTQEALDAKLEGVVRLEAIVGVDGSVSEIKVVQSLDKGLDKKAVESVTKWSFRPGTQGDKRQPAKMTVDITFRLPTASSPLNNVKSAMAFRFSDSPPLGERPRNSTFTIK